jgi:hypothetical protein
MQQPLAWLLQQLVRFLLHAATLSNPPDASYSLGLSLTAALLACPQD